MNSSTTPHDASIKAGDLVMIVRPACCQNEFQGFPFTVQKIVHRNVYCTGCGNYHDGLFALTGRKERPSRAPLYTLMKVDPPKVDETTKEKICEPA